MGRGAAGIEKKRNYLKNERFVIKDVNYKALVPKWRPQQTHMMQTEKFVSRGLNTDIAQWFAIGSISTHL